MDCHANATCIDLEGGFECECVTGYTGNGTQCDGKVRQNPLLHAKTYNSIIELNYIINSKMMVKLTLLQNVHHQLFSLIKIIII